MGGVSLPLSEFTIDALFMLVMLVLADLRLKSNFGIYLPLTTLADIAARAQFSFLTASSHFDTSRKYFC